MPVVIRELVSEIALGPEVPAERAEAGMALTDEVLERVTRQVTERVLARLRLEWEE